MQGVLLIENAVTDKINVMSNSGNKIIFEAVLQTVDDRNRNNRIYRRQSVEQAINEIKPKLKEGNFGGELDHPIPSSDETQTWIRHTTFMYKEACHKINELYFDGNKLVGVCETLSTPNGYILAGLLRDKIQVGFSARAISDNVETKNGIEYVLPPITYISFDAVSNPSHSEAKLIKIRRMEQYMHQGCKGGICRILEHVEQVKSKRKKPLYSFFTNSDIQL